MLIIKIYDVLYAPKLIIGRYKRCNFYSIPSNVKKKEPGLQNNNWLEPIILATFL